MANAVMIISFFRADTRPDRDNFVFHRRFLGGITYDDAARRLCFLF